MCVVSDELTRLWNLNHDNMEACKSDSRSVNSSENQTVVAVSSLDPNKKLVFDMTRRLSFREFMPSLDEFFAEAIEQADPANMVEDEYKYVYTFLGFLKNV